MLKVYSKSNCPNCMVIKNFLKSKSIEYEEFDIMDPEVMTSLIMDNVSVMSIPIVSPEKGIYYYDMEEVKKIYA